MSSDEISKAINQSFKEPNDKDPNELVDTFRAISIYDIIWSAGLDNETDEIMDELNDSSVSSGSAVNTLISQENLLDILSNLQDVNILPKIKGVLDKLTGDVLVGLDS